VFGPLPAAGYRVTFKYTTIRGLNGVKVGDFNASTNKLSLIELTLADLADGIEMTAFTCDQVCEAKTSCGECASDPICGQCGSKCVYENTDQVLEECSEATLIRNNACCPDCSQAATCDQCAQLDSCAWDFELNKCVSGLFKDPTNTFFCETGPRKYLATSGSGECSYPPGAINAEGRLANPRQTPVAEFCTGHGTPNFQTNTCACSPGYFGAGKPIVGPGGAGDTALAAPRIPCHESTHFRFSVPSLPLG
jgi:hypothetical protein